jgi:uncharacterized protein with HEPN domain
MQRLDDRARLHHMREAARKIQTFSSGKTRAVLDSDEILYSALTWLFQVLGEAARHVSKEFRSAHPEFEWDDIIDFRHRIVHGYDTIDKDILWGIIQYDVPPLMKALESLDWKNL